jgi:hypothetical protein
MLTMHVVTPTGRVSVDLTGAQAWSFAGALIDATIAHSQASATSPATVQALVTTPLSELRVDGPLWLLDRHPNGRMPTARTRRLVRCFARRGRRDRF